MKKLLFGLLLISLNSLAQDTSMTMIYGEDLVCGNTDVEFSINIHEKKVWQADPGERVGLDLNIISFKNLQCEKCFDIEAELNLFGQSISYLLKTRLNNVNGQMKTILRVDVDGRFEVEEECLLKIKE